MHDVDQTPVFATLCLEYPDLVWDQPYVEARSWDGATVRVVPAGPLTTL
ncbi:hypothetical protein PBI_MAUREEN_31 [Arthrobacter phage Maureen]|uniref:Uncharacterized protein n=1 Tax=Arthrobacter phage Maureen TaxID=2419961 RepID=A0A3G2KHP3_9CAUD|nr:hypothetical protein PBI_MAUREEN_31 [Arthrobacter phage Maureen]